MERDVKLLRYMDSLKEEALKHIIKELLYGDKEIILSQIREFNKMYPNRY